MSGRSPGGIFISYRRQETAWPARQMYEVLVGRFGAGEVFKDVDNIEPGEDFVERITSAVASCRVLLAMIGSQWTTLTDAGGRRRIDDPDDFVRLEIRTALERGVTVIPVLVDGAAMPAREDLPDDLVPLVRKQAVEVSPVNFDTERLFATLRQVVDQRADRRPEELPTRPTPVLADPGREVPGPDARIRRPRQRILWLTAAVLVATVLVAALVVRPWRARGQAGGIPANPTRSSTLTPSGPASPSAPSTVPPSRTTTQAVPHDGTGPQVLAHRGGWEHHQLETREAMERSALDGYAVETDVRWTRDEVAVLVHDDAGTEGLDCAGGTQLSVSTHTWKQLQACRSKPVAADRDTHPVPQYDATMEGIAAASPTAWVYVELKVDRTDAQLRTFLGVLSDHGLTDRAVVTSVDRDRLRQVHRVAPGTRTLLFVQTQRVPASDLAADRLWGVAVRRPLLSAGYVRSLRTRHLVVVGWLLNDEQAWSQARAVGVDKLLTDYPDRCRDWLQNH